MKTTGKHTAKTTNSAKYDAIKRRDGLSIFKLFERFPTEGAVIDYFKNSRYGDTVACPRCGEKHRISPKKNERPSMYQCNTCNNSFSIFHGTIFENTKTDLRKWMYAILQIGTNAKKGISACQLQRDISVTYKTAWRMLKQIRLAMANTADLELIKSVVEVDETYLGGSPRNKHESKRGRGTTKIPVVGVLDRQSGKVFVQPMMPDAQGKKLTGKQLLAVIEKHAHKNAMHVTDDFSGYNILSEVGRKHTVVNHSAGEYVNIAGYHTNGIENFWSLVKRMHHGVYHKMGVNYVALYLAEQAFRYSNRFELENISDKILKQAVLK